MIDNHSNKILYSYAHEYRKIMQVENYEFLLLYAG